MPTAGLPTAEASPTLVPTATETALPVSQDCGQDVACLVAAAQNCQPATGQYVLDMDIAGAQVHTVLQFDIHGLTEEGQCAFDVALVEVSVQFSEDAKQQMRANGMSEEDIAAQRRMIEEQQRQNGPSGSCLGRGEDLAAMLQRWQAGHFALDDWAPFTCTGGTLGPAGEAIEVTVEVTAEVTVAPPSPQPTMPTGAYPPPMLAYYGTESIDKANTRYWIGVTNWQAYPDEWFQPAPDLPPCGQNPNAARAWVMIYRADSGAEIYGFCALTKPEDLARLWFAWPAHRPAPEVYVEIWDRATDQHYRSAPIRLGEGPEVGTPTPRP